MRLTKIIILISYFKCFIFAQKYKNNPMKNFFSLFILTSFISFSQTKYEYFGALKLNGDERQIITYRIVFTEKKGVIEGYSITDIGGENETKNNIVGSYNSKSNSFNFKELGILYTKSAISQDSFCFVNFVGKVKLGTQNSKVDGAFSGMFKNKTKCIDGKVSLVNLSKIEKKINTMNKKVRKSVFVDKETKAKVKSVSILDSLTVNSLKKDQNLNVFVYSKEINLEIWDTKIEDGDKIDLYHNGRKILDYYTVLNKKKTIKIKLDDDKNVFRIEAISEGERKMNTAKIHLIDDKRVFEMSTNLKKGEKASITIIKN